MTAYYNEFDPKAAAWLRELIKAGLIADGIVDERSILDVKPSELAGYTQCHFFAGIGGWSLALRLAGWPDDRPVWTGSCPCQPFSAAGKGAGFADERHLWPYWLHLIQHGKQRNVPVFGEQVASKDGLAWLDLVHADLEGAGYAVGAFDLCAAGVGAPHIRQRLWFVAQGLEHAELSAQSRQRFVGGSAVCEQEATGFARNGMAGELVGNSGDTGMLFRNGATTAGGLANSDSAAGWENARSTSCDEKADGRAGQNWVKPNSNNGFASYGENMPASPTNGIWRDSDWLFCRDGKFRPVEPGTSPLADGLPGRVGLLRGYGNAIVPEVAAEVIGAYMEIFNQEK